MRSDVRAEPVEALVLDHLDLAASLARRVARSAGEVYDDLFQVASLALLKAARNYDPGVGDFRPYARRTILGDLMHHLRDLGWSVRPARRLQEQCLALGRIVPELEQQLGRSPSDLEIAAALGMAASDVPAARAAQRAWRAEWLGEPHASTGSLVSEDGGYGVIELAELLGSIEWSEREARLLNLRIATDLTQHEIAQLVGVSQMTISRDLAHLERKLRALLGAEAEEPRRATEPRRAGRELVAT